MMSLPLATGIMGGLVGGFGSPNYQDAYNKYAQNLQQLSANYNPYIRAGAGAEAGLAGIGIHNLIDPAALENKLASSYQDSPYQTQMLHNTQRMMDANAAQTGMVGSTAQKAALQNALAGQENQFQQQYIDRGTQNYLNSLRNLQSLGMMLGQQGYGAFNQKQGLLQGGALAQLQGGLQPNPWQEALIGGAGGALAGLHMEMPQSSGGSYY